MRSIQFKNCGWTAGFMEFTFPGSNDRKGGAISENEYNAKKSSFLIFNKTKFTISESPANLTLAGDFLCTQFGHMIGFHKQLNFKILL